MTTIINNPNGGERGDSSGVGIILGVILAVVLIALFFVYGLPAMRGATPSGSTINVPDKVDVNINHN